MNRSPLEEEIEYLEELESSGDNYLCEHDSVAGSSDEMINYGSNLSESLMGIAEGEDIGNSVVLAESAGYSRDKLPDGLFGCWLLVSVRDFKGHSSGKDIGKWGVSGNNPEDFIHNCWKLSEKYLKREVVFIANESGLATPSWSSRSLPEEVDFVRFALLKDKSNHRCYTIDKVTPTLLQNWRNKEIQLLLHVYSLSVNSKGVFKTVRDTLLEPEERDKAGAASNKSLSELVQKLRHIHGTAWQANDISWMMWANAILTSEANQQDILMQEAPPAHLAKLFATKEQPRLRAIRRSYAVAHNVNSGYHDEIIAIREAFDDLEKSTQNMMCIMKLLKRRIESLEHRDVIGESFISAAEDALNVEETVFGASLASSVGVMDEIDHQ